MNLSMDFMQVVLKRKSVRSFKTDPVPDVMVNWIVDMAKKAPSAGAIRGYKIIVTHKQLTNYIAPLHVVVCAMPDEYVNRYGRRGVQLYAIQDATIVGAYLQLAAVDQGLATVWVGAFRESRVKRELGLGDEMKPVAIFPLGYAA